VTAVVKESYSANKQVIFSGDNYTEEWHAEAEQRGLKNLKTTPDALPEVLAEQTVEVFDRYGVLNERELESRYEVWVEQYSTRANIEAETAAQIARTLILPAAARHLTLLQTAGIDGFAARIAGLANELTAAIEALEEANAVPDGLEGLELAVYARDNQLAAMDRVREVADQLEHLIADDLWPLPKYSETLFIK
jgi:glutamine synthetase